MDAKHPEDRPNQTLLCAARRGDSVDMTWPDNLALARYVWRKLGTALAEAEFRGAQYALAEDMVGAEVKGDVIEFFGPVDLGLAKYLYARLGDALDDKEWEAYQKVAALQAQMVKGAQQRVELGDARTLKSHRGGRN